MFVLNHLIFGFISIGILSSCSEQTVTDSELAADSYQPKLSQRVDRVMNDGRQAKYAKPECVTNGGDYKTESIKGISLYDEYGRKFYDGSREKMKCKTKTEFPCLRFALFQEWPVEVIFDEIYTGTYRSDRPECYTSPIREVVDLSAKLPEMPTWQGVFVDDDGIEVVLGRERTGEKRYMFQKTGWGDTWYYVGNKFVSTKLRARHSVSYEAIGPKDEAVQSFHIEGDPRNPDTPGQMSLVIETKEFRKQYIYNIVRRN